MVRKTSALIVLAVGLAACGDREIASAKERIANRMKDPDSVQFRNVERCYENEEVIQGQYNAKNSYGAYVGFQSFFSSKQGTVTIGDPQFESIMDECFKNVPKLTDEQLYE